MRISSNIISYIHGISKGFVDENLSEEAMFFDDIWEAYEVELKKWITKSSKRWRFKGSKIKHPKFLSISGKTKPLDLDTPKIIDALVNSITQIALIKNHLTTEKIREILDRFGEKISDTIKGQFKEFAASVLLQDSGKMGLIPVIEKDVKREFKDVPPLELGRDELSRKKVEERKEYKVYSHEYPNGNDISKSRFEQIKDDYKKNEEGYLFLIYQKEDEFYYGGNPEPIQQKEKIALKFLIENAGKLISYKDLYKEIQGVLPGDWEEKQDTYENYVHKTISDLHATTDGKLKSFFKTKRKKGYIFKPGKVQKFFLIEWIGE